MAEHEKDINNLGLSYNYIDKSIVEEEDPKLIFLEKALSDDNYINKNCLVFCYQLLKI